MILHTTSTCLALLPGRVTRLHLRAGTRLRGVRGTAWLTADGDPRDIVLEPGQQFRRDSRAGTIVYALEPARLTLQHEPVATATRVAAHTAPRRVLALD